MSLIKGLLNLFTNNTAYIQVWEDRVRVVNIKTGVVFDEVPWIALEKNTKGIEIVKAVGNAALAFKNLSDFRTQNPFSHPRLLVANFRLAEKFLTHAVKQVFKDQLFAASPRIVFQPMEKLEGEMTDIENRVYRELCLGAGAREVVIYIGKTVANQDFNFEALKQQDIKIHA